METELPLAVQRTEPSAGEMMAAIIKGGVTQENVLALKELVPLYERMEAKKAEREFNAAFTALQQELPAVKALKPVADRSGNVKFRVATYDQIMTMLQPLLQRFGFSVRFSSRADEKRVTMICTVMHAAGHSVNNEFSCRIGSGPPGATESQADGSAASYAQRNALCDAFNIIIRQDDSDPRDVGETITPEQAFELERRVAESNSKRDVFLRLGEADMNAKNPFQTILANRYDELDQMLRRKEQGK